MVKMNKKPMKKSDYLSIFESFMDNSMWRQGIIFAAAGLTKEERAELLDEIAYRCQAEFGMTAYLVTNNTTDYIDSEVSIIDKAFDPYLLPNLRSTKPIFLVDLEIPYFENSQSWEYKIVELLIYYKYTFYGFSTRQKMIVYED